MLIYIVRTALIGCAAGWAAAKLNNLDSSNWVNNLILGILGSFVGSFVGSLIGIHSTNMIGSILVSIAGACLAIWVDKTYIHKA